MSVNFRSTIRIKRRDSSIHRKKNNCGVKKINEAAFFLRPSTKTLTTGLLLFNVDLVVKRICIINQAAIGRRGIVIISIIWRKNNVSVSAVLRLPLTVNFQLLLMLLLLLLPPTFPYMTLAKVRIISALVAVVVLE